jgi:hypothetical protein
MNTKKILLAIFVLSIFTSCSPRYRGYRTNTGCGVWFPSKFEGENNARKKITLAGIGSFIVASTLVTLKSINK